LAIFAAEHHEKMDGSGYPQGLKGEQMSLESRLLAMADMFAAMAENRPYRSGMDPAKILEILGSDVPKKLDPVCFEALKGVVKRWNWLESAETTQEVGEFGRPHPKHVVIEEELAQLI